MKNGTSVRVVEYDDSKAEEWRSFVQSSSNGTMFHYMEFLDYHPPGRFSFRHLMFLEGNRLTAVIPGACEGGVYSSPAGASMGGFVTPPQLGLGRANGIVRAFIGYCREHGITSVNLTPPMNIYRDSCDMAMEYALCYNGFTVSRMQYSSVSMPSESSLSRKVAYNIRLAKRKGVEILEENDFDLFYPILLENKAKFGVPPTHTLEELKLIDKLMPGYLKLFLAMLDGEAIAGSLLFLANANCAMNFYTMHRYEYRKLYPVSLLVKHTSNWLAERGFRYFDYGVSMDTASENPIEPSWSLVRFKESLGFQGCIRYSWSLALQAPADTFRTLSPTE